MEQLAGDVEVRGVEVTEDVSPVMLGRIYGEDPHSLPVRGDGSVSKENFNRHLEDLWLEAMADCGEVVHKKAA